MSDAEFPMPEHLVELDKALDEGLAKAIPLIIREVDKERTEIITNKINDLLRTRQYEAYNEDYLNGIRETLKVIRD